MRTRVDRWGNSLGVRIPKAIAERADLREGSHVEMDVENGAVILRRSKPQYTLDELLEGVTPDMIQRDLEIEGSVGAERWWEDEE